MEIVIWVVVCVISCALGGGVVAGFLSNRLMDAQEANKAWAESHAKLAKKKKKLKARLLRALVKLEYGQK